jgi:hypothetical protein
MLNGNSEVSLPPKTSRNSDISILHFLSYLQSVIKFLNVSNLSEGLRRPYINIETPILYCYVLVRGVFFSVALQTLSGSWPPLAITRIGHTHSVRLLWTSDQTEAQTFTWQHKTITRDEYRCPRRVFEPAIPESERPQTYALDRAASGIGMQCSYGINR